jgi:hypothetical protein
MNRRSTTATLGFVGLLAGVSCTRGEAAKDDRTTQSDGPREFRAARAPKRVGLDVTVRDALDRVAHGGEEVSESELVATLVDAMNRETIGAADRRDAAAREVVREIMAAATRFKGTHAGSTQMRQRALNQQAATLVRTLEDASGHRVATPPSFGPRPEGTRRLPWGELTDVYEEGAELPESVRALDGQQVAMAGYLVEGAFDELLLVKSVWGCCFGEPPGVDEAVVVTVEGPVLYPWFEGVVRVIGPLEVGPQYDDGQLLSIYRMRAVQVDTL